MRFYIATGFARQKEHNQIRDALIAQGHHVTYDWTMAVNQQPGQEPEIAEGEIWGVTSSDFVVVLLPGKFGTHAELGAALASNIKVFLSGPKDAACIFYHHPLVSYIEDETKLLGEIRTWVEEEYDRARANEP